MNTENKIGMLIVTSKWRNKKSFKMIPLTIDCPYNECIFDPENKVLAIVSKEKKDNFHLMPKLDDNGDLLKSKRSRPDGKTFSEQRVVLDTYYEYFISEEAEMIEFIDMYAINASTYKYKEMIDAAFNPKIETI